MSDKYERKKMELCQSGFHSSNSQSLKTYRLDHDLIVAICDICFDTLTVANSQGLILL